MGQKVSPIGFRTGVTIGWKSRWFAPKSNYGEFLVEDAKMRKFIDQRLNRQPPYAAISGIEIERTREEVKVILKTARPGLVIGPKGAEVEKLKEALEDLTDRRVSISITEIRNPDLDAQLLAEGLAEQLKRRASFRRTLKMRAESAMQAGAKGVKIIISGRLGGAEIARSEMQLMGSIPLHTLEADVDYGFAPSFTTYGVIGVKVWVYRGMFGEQVKEDDAAPASASMTRARRRRERHDGGHGGPGRGGPGGGGGRRRSSAGPRTAPAPAPATPDASAPEAAPAAPAEAPAAPAPDVSAPAPVEQPPAAESAPAENPQPKADE